MTWLPSWVRGASSLGSEVLRITFSPPNRMIPQNEKGPADCIDGAGCDNPLITLFWKPVMPFEYTHTFQLAHSHAPMRKLSSDFVSLVNLQGKQYLQVAPEALTLLARTAFDDVSF